MPKSKIDERDILFLIACRVNVLWLACLVVFSSRELTFSELELFGKTPPNNPPGGGPKQKLGPRVNKRCLG